MVRVDTEALLERFLRYVRIDTESSETGAGVPSTDGQWNLLRLLRHEIAAMELVDVELDRDGFTLGTLPGNREGAPCIGFLAHVDTATDFSGRDVKPLVHRAWDGSVLVLPDDPSQRLDPALLPALAAKRGETIITASGTTLLGADDKAGVAIVMSLLETLLANPSLPRPPVRVCFSPDEEIGRGMDYLDIRKLPVRAAYTLDAEHPGEIVYETFSADKAVVTITGVASHPGWAKGVMVNALTLGADFVSRLAQGGDTPEHSSGREGYLHPNRMEGDASEVRLSILLRDFELPGLEKRASRIRELCKDTEKREPRCRVKLEVMPQYRNMRYWLEKDMLPVEQAREAMRRAGIDPVSIPFRGGTDGSKLTEKGIPTPNLFCGFHNIHGPLEWVSLEDMERSVRVLVELCGLWTEGKR